MEKEDCKNFVVLVVDDEEDYAAIISRMLGLEGFQTLVAHSGHQAVETLKSAKVHAVISDVRMSDGDGLELLTNINSNKSTDLLAFAFITGFTESNPEELLSLGADKVFPKPIDLGEVVQFLKTTITKKQELRHDSSEPRLFGS